jgi:methylsterol monooxygenase
VGTYVIANGFFMFVDLTGKPHQLHKYKIQENVNIPVNWQKYKKCLKVVTFNSVIVGTLFLVVTWPIAKWSKLNCGYDLPSFPQIIFHLLFFVICEEIGFYYLHRMLHHRYFYSRIHKMHHEWTAPVSIASVYCHPIEHFLSNVFPIMSGPLLLGDYFGNHLASAWLWIFLAITNTTISHCGYHLPFISSPEAHDFHHSKFNQNFGVLGILDRLHGTDNVFRKSKDYERHIVLTSLTSAKELIPDQEKKCISPCCD